MADNREIIIKKAYELLERVTPVSYDCGNICEKKCCRGSSHDGMLLLPGEDELFCDKDGFSVYYDDRYSCFAVSCKGECNRDLRPFACRIFPYFIYMNEDKATVAPDIRAISFCPLLDKGNKIDKKYLRSLRICAALLSSDEEFRKYLTELTAILTDFNSL